jgi:hypothetical protein
MMRHARGGCAGLDAADPDHLAAIEDAEQLGLHRERHLAELVEQQRPCVGRLKQPRAGARRAGERALSWPNSSLSSRVSGIAAQLIRSIGRLARSERAWTRAGYPAHPGANAAGAGLVAGLDRLPRLCSK